MKFSDHRNAEGDFRERNIFESHAISWKSSFGGETLSWFAPIEFDVEKWPPQGFLSQAIRKWAWSSEKGCRCTDLWKKSEIWCQQFQALHRALYITSKTKTGPTLLLPKWIVPFSEKLELVPHILWLVSFFVLFYLSTFVAHIWEFTGLLFIYLFFNLMFTFNQSNSLT